jgi:hypothetical protein
LEANLRHSLNRHEVLDNLLQNLVSGTPKYLETVDEILRIEDQILRLAGPEDAELAEYRT